MHHRQSCGSCGHFMQGGLCGCHQRPFLQPAAQPIVCPPQFRVRDSFIPRMQPVIHPIVNVNREHIVNVPQHFVTETNRNVVVPPPQQAFPMQPGFPQQQFVPQQFVGQQFVGQQFRGPGPGQGFGPGPGQGFGPGPMPGLGPMPGPGPMQPRY